MRPPRSTRQPTSSKPNSMPSPPLPPHHHDDPVSDDESLGESFINIGSGDEEDSRSSTLGSLDESMLDETLTASSRGSVTSEHRLSPTLLEGSYVDGEATDTEVSQSITTHDDSISSSHIRLIMPNPEASFLTTSGTLSDVTTPNASLANLRTIDEPGRLDLPGLPRRKRGLSPGRGVPRSWLEESSKLWNVSPDLAHSVQEGGEYTLLASQEVPFGSAVEKEEMQKQPEVLRRRANIREALAAAQNYARKRNVAFSVLLLAGIVLGLHSFPSSAGNSIKRLVTSTPGNTQAPVGATAGPTTSIWEHLPISPLPATSLLAETVSSPASTPRIPDLNLIKHALSTFSTAPLKQSPRDPITTTLPDKAKSRIFIKDSISASVRRASSSNSKACCSLSVRPSDVALSAAISSTLSKRDDAWARVMRHTVKRANASHAVPVVNVTEPCSCSLMQHVKLDMWNRLHHVAIPAKGYAIVFGDYFDHIYGPVMAELHRELSELLALANSIAETTSTLSQFIIGRAARGVSVSRHALDTVTSRVKPYIPLPMPLVYDNEAEAKQVAREAVALAKASYDHLSGYVDEQTVVMQENLKQAKRGLDKLIDRAKRVIGETREERIKTDVKVDGPMPFSLMDRRFRRAGRVQRAFRRLERKAERMRRSMYMVEPPTRARRVWDAVHHGAVALVLR